MLLLSIGCQISELYSSLDRMVDLASSVLAVVGMCGFLKRLVVSSCLVVDAIAVRLLISVLKWFLWSMSVPK